MGALLAASADPNLGELGDYTPLIVVTHGGKFAAVEALLSAGADAMAKAKGGETELLWAARCS